MSCSELLFLFLRFVEILGCILNDIILNSLECKLCGQILFFFAVGIQIGVSFSFALAIDILFCGCYYLRVSPLFNILWFHVEQEIECRKLGVQFEQFLSICFPRYFTPRMKFDPIKSMFWASPTRIRKLDRYLLHICTWLRIFYHFNEEVLPTSWILIDQ